MARTRHLLFLDESGTHDMQQVDRGWPVFVLVGLLVGEKYYQNTLVPRVKQFKVKHGLSVDVVLHSRDIRRREGEFAFLSESEGRRFAFYEDINRLVSGLRTRFFSVVIDKARLRSHFAVPISPYDISLS